MANIIIRVEDKEKAEFEKAAKDANMSLSAWIRGLARSAATERKPSASKATAAERQVPFNPAGPEVMAVPVKVRKSKKIAVPPAEIQVEAATVKRKVAEQPPVAAPVDRNYTGESYPGLSGRLVYSYLDGNGRRRETFTAPPVKQ